MKLVFVTQTLDPSDAVLAQTVDLVRALAPRVDELRLISRTASLDDVPPNANVRTFDAPRRAERVAAYERAIVPSVRGADGVLVHMVPEFAILAAPATRLRGVPLLLWYTHWHAGRALAFATRVVQGVLSVDRASFPIETPKLHGIGHAIDVDLFAPRPSAAGDGALKLLAVGRTARWKGLVTLLDALALARAHGSGAVLEIRGPSLTPDEVAHRAELVRRVSSDARLTGAVTICDPVPRAEMPDLLATAQVVVSPNEPRSGATFDKAVFEAAACARPVVSTTMQFASLLGDVPLPLLAPPRDPQSLAAAINAVLGAEPSVRAETGAQLSRRVVRDHSLEHWADRVIQVVSEVRSRRGG
jgi:glycosyltransferase involved in cell wall biosynthesis